MVNLMGSFFYFGSYMKLPRKYQIQPIVQTEAATTEGRKTMGILT